MAVPIAFVVAAVLLACAAATQLAFCPACGSRQWRAATYLALMAVAAFGLGLVVVLW